MVVAQQIAKVIPVPPDAAGADESLPRGAEVLLEALVHEGVDTIFGYPGGAVLHIYDELWRYRERITHFTEALPFLSDQDKELIMGGSLAKCLGWPI